MPPLMGASPPPTENPGSATALISTRETRMVFKTFFFLPNFLFQHEQR